MQVFKPSIRSPNAENKMQDPPKRSWIHGLNPSQAEAVAANASAAVLVLAGAGSGKTTVLTRRVAFLMDAAARDAGILALTFTKDAAREMEIRLRKLVPEKTDPVGFPYIGTFHSFALKLIRSEFDGGPNWKRLGFARCPGVIDPAERHAWLSAAKREMGLEEPVELLEEWVSSPDAETDARPSGGAGGKAGPEEPARAELRRRFREHALAIGAVGFDEMVPMAERLLAEHPDLLAQVRGRYGHILVDEFQDTSRDQLRLVKALAGGGRSLFLVGDDDQAIYGFRGADPRNIGAALECFPGMAVIKLETNYRSSSAIVDYANAVFADKPAALRKRLEAGCDRGRAPVRTVVHDSGPEQARWMIGEMERLRREDGLAWSDIAVLFRINALEPYYRSMLERLAGPDAAREAVLSTVHAAKGLEYPAVFFVGLEDGIVPFRRRKDRLEPDRLAEERRIFYVGVTRAQRHLYLCSCRRRMLRGKMVEAPESPFLRMRAASGSAARFPGLRGPLGMLRRIRAWRREKDGS